MKLLLDTCVWGGAVQRLREWGHDVVWSGDWDTDPGDQEILRIAHQEGRVLITLDKDFGELAIVFRYPHAGILGWRESRPVSRLTLSSLFLKVTVGPWDRERL